MTKVAGTYDSLIKGVSEQVAHQRFPGQHWEQTNMVSDPVRGLSRRRGSVRESEMPRPGVTLSAATLEDCKRFGEQSVYVGINEFSFMFRRERRLAGSSMPGLVVVNKTTGQIIEARTSTQDPNIGAYLDAGITSVTAVGRLILMSVNDTPTTYSIADKVAAPSAQPNDLQNRSVMWIRSGAYSRTYTFSVKTVTGMLYTGSVTTPASYYPGMLDTSDIPATIPDGEGVKPNPDYQKLVNDRVYAYQSAVNAWIGSAAAAIQPSAIAQSIVNVLQEWATTNPGTGLGVTRANSTVVMSGVVSVSVDDGADGSGAVGVARVVKQASDLSTVHTAGKVVKIQPETGSSKAYYVRAVETSPNPVNVDWPNVRWEEAAGIEVTPGFVCLIGTVSNGVFYVASSPARLADLAGVNVPNWSVSSSGDLESQQLPTFLGKPIDYLRMFQDRLLIVSGSTFFLSRSGDYFNLFRTSALTVVDNDPIEMFALGSEDDVVTAGAMLDRNLILFGKQWQYAISGREAITPTSAFVAVQSGYRDSNICPPEVSGALIFFTQKRQGKLTMQQMQTGAYADTLTATEVSQQLNSYLAGTPRQLVATTAPSAVFVSVREQPNSFWVYSYLDDPSGQERLFDAWSRWEFDASLGTLVGMTSKDGDLLVTTLRNLGTGVALVCDRFTMRTDLPDTHLDSQRPYSAGAFSEAFPGIAQVSVSYGEAAGDYWMLGDSWARAQNLIAQAPGQTANLKAGVNFSSFVTVTNPFVRNYKDVPILDGRLTLGSFQVTLYQSAAMDVFQSRLVDKDQSYVRTQRWIARTAGAWVLNTQQVEESKTITVPVQQETRDVKVRFASRTWLPLTLATLEWTGQLFTRRR